MYVNKKKAKDIKALVLRTKVRTRTAAEARERGEAFEDYHLEWTAADCAHKGVLALMGDTEAATWLRRARDEVQCTEAAYIIHHYLEPHNV